MLLSRVADALYWISRYLERAEHTSRVIKVRLDLDLDRHTHTEGWNFERLYTSVQLPATEPLPANPTALIEAAVLDSSNRESVVACVNAARENARQVREEISSEMWEQINALFLQLKQVRDDGIWTGRPHSLLRMVIDGVHLFQGVTDATLDHGEGWQFLQVGRFLERARSVARLVDLNFSNSSRIVPYDDAEWVGMLRSCSALEAYCRHYTADVRPERIAEFLLLSPDFPRSVRFSAARVGGALRAVSQLTGRSAGGRAERLAGRLHASLDYGQVDEILSDDPHAYVDSIVRHCDQIHTAIYQSYIAYAIESALPA